VSTFIQSKYGGPQIRFDGTEEWFLNFVLRIRTDIILKYLWLLANLNIIR
jgi:hypothetical protein